jgi:DNA recombination protein RmuC
MLDTLTQLDRQTLLAAMAGLTLLSLFLGLSVLGRGRSLRRARRELLDQAVLREDLAAARAKGERLPSLERELAQWRDAHSSEAAAAAALREELRALKEGHAARLEELRGMKQEMEDRFAKLASSVLKDNSDAFLGLVSERFQQHSQAAEEDLKKRHSAIEGLVKPLDEKLGAFDRQIQEIEKARNEAYGAMRQQMAALNLAHRDLGQETRKLVQALRAPKTRGRWGEMQMRQVFEMAGMAEKVDYLLEKGVGTDEGLRRPDAVIRIPGGRSIVVDAKTPLEAYLDALDAETPEAQAQKLGLHAQHIRSHVKLLASKAYQAAIPQTPDFIVMFIPGETFVSAAAEADPGLIEFAFEKKVLIATPTTLMALIKSIAYGWQQEKMAENAVEVQKLARDLYDRLAVFAGHVEKLGRALGQSVDSYNRAVGSLESRILPAARKFETLGVVSAQAQLSVASVEQEPRRLTAPELVAAEGN